MVTVSLYRSMPSISIKVVPGSSRDAILGEREMAIRIGIAASPEKDKANQRLSRFLSDCLDMKQSQIHIVQGQKARNKVIAFSDASLEEVKKKLISLLEEGKK